MKENHIFITEWETDALRFIENSLGWKNHDARSLYHDACLLCIENLSTGKIKEITKPYLFQVCKNLGANTFRNRTREKKRFHLFFEQEKRHLMNQLKQQYMMDLTIGNEKATKAIFAFYKLGDSCQNLIRLKHQEGKSFKEIITQWKTFSSEESARTTLYRCMKKWKQLIKSSDSSHGK